MIYSSGIRRQAESLPLNQHYTIFVRILSSHIIETQGIDEAAKQAEIEDVFKFIPMNCLEFVESSRLIVVCRSQYCVCLFDTFLLCSADKKIVCAVFSRCQSFLVGESILFFSSSDDSF